MSVDRNGMIEVVGKRPFQDDFRPLLDEVRSRLSPHAGRLLHSVYVYGSVAAGRAVPTRSDLDLSLVLCRPPAEQDSHLIEGIRRTIEAGHPVVSKVDFDIGSLEDILSAESGMAWRYWLRHHCRCILGSDLTQGIPLFRPSRTLARAVNGDFGHVLQGYRNALAAAPSASAARRLVREASRKLIRSTNMLRGEADTDWPHTLEEHVVRFRSLFPVQGQELHFFLRQAREPDADPACFSGRLQAFADWMTNALHGGDQ